MVAKAIKLVAGQAFLEAHEAEVDEARGQADPDRHQKNRRRRGPRPLRFAGRLACLRLGSSPAAIPRSGCMERPINRRDVTERLINRMAGANASRRETVDLSDHHSHAAPTGAGSAPEAGPSSDNDEGSKTRDPLLTTFIRMRLRVC